MFGLRGWLTAVFGSAVALIVLGVPTAIIDTPFFLRMIEVRTQDYAIWIVSASLVGLIAGTYAITSGVRTQGGIIPGGLLSFFAVGCPVCNKIVLLALGTSGALTFFAPAQLYIGLVSIAVLAYTLLIRAGAIAEGCSVSALTPVDQTRAST